MLPLALVSVTLPVTAFTAPLPVMSPAIDWPPVMLISPPAVVTPFMERPFASTTVRLAVASSRVALIVLMLVLTATEFRALILRTLPTT